MKGSVEELKRLQNMDIMELKREDLVDAQDIVINPSKHVEERIQTFIEQTKNPFAQKVGSYILQMEYMEDTDDGFDERMMLWMERMAEITII